MERTHTFTGETSDTPIVAGENAVVSDTTKYAHGEHVTDKMATVAANVVPHNLNAKQDDISNNNAVVPEDESKIKKPVKLTCNVLWLSDLNTLYTHIYMLCTLFG